MKKQTIGFGIILAITAVIVGAMFLWRSDQKPLPAQDKSSVPGTVNSESSSKADSSDLKPEDLTPGNKQNYNSNKAAPPEEEKKP